MDLTLLVCTEDQRPLWRIEIKAHDIKKLGFQNHGLVIRSPEGKVLWKQPDHQVKMEDVREAIRELLEG